jgi:hypothetical protein
MNPTEKPPSLREIDQWARKADLQKKKFVELPQSLAERGIVTCGGSYRYFCNAWVLCRLLRHLGCQLEIELWICSEEEWSPEAQVMCGSMGVIVRNAADLKLEVSSGRLSGWQLKSVAIAHSRFQQVLFLDADNVPTRDPSFLFDSPHFRIGGAIFWPDRGKYGSDNPIFKVLRIPFVEDDIEVESGQMLINRERHGPALAFAMWMNLNAKFFYRLLFGDKDTFPMAMKVYGTNYTLIPFPIRDIGPDGGGVMLGHDFEGSVIFQHRHRYKWCAIAENPRIPGFQHEALCLSFLKELKQVRTSFASSDFGRPSKGADNPVGEVYFIRELKEQANYGDGWKGNDKNAYMAGHDLDIVLGDPENVAGHLRSPVVIPVNKLKELVNGAQIETASRWTAISFEEDGTIGEGAADERLFYRARSGRLEYIFGASKRRLALQPTSYGYLGFFEGHKGGGSAALVSLSSINPQLSSGTETVKVDTNLDTLSEAVATTRACMALHGTTGVPVIYYTRWARWLKAFEGAGVIFKKRKKEPQGESIDPRSNTPEMIRYGLSRFEWFCKSLGADPAVEIPKPFAQVDLNEFRSVVDLKNYLLLLPEAEWPEEPPAPSFWRRFIRDRINEGFEIIVGVSPQGLAPISAMIGRSNAFFVKLDNPQVFLNLAIGAKGIYTGDNGFAHLCAAVGVPSIHVFSVVMPARFSWHGYSTVTVVQSSAGCSGCRRAGLKGYDQGCVNNCYGATQFK